MSETAICDGTRTARAEHALALAEDGGPQSKRTGLRALTMIAAGCAE